MRKTEDLNYDDQVNHLGHIDEILKRSKRDKLDHLHHNNHNHHHNHHQNPSDDTLGSVISNFVRNAKDSRVSSKKRKQLVCFTQNYDDDLKKNLEAAVKFNALIDRSSGAIVRNNRNILPAPQSSKNKSLNSVDMKHLKRKNGNSSSDKNNIKGWLNLGKNDIVLLAKNLNKKISSEKSVSVPLTSLVPPEFEGQRVSNIRERAVRFDDLNKGNHYAMFPSAMKRKHMEGFSRASTKMETGGFKPMIMRRKQPLLNTKSSEEDEQSQFRDRSFDTSPNAHSRNNQLEKSSDYSSEVSRLELKTLRPMPEQIVDSLVANPEDSKHLRNLLFPGRPNPGLRVHKARRIFEKTLTTKNNRVRIQSYEQ